MAHSNTRVPTKERLIAYYDKLIVVRTQVQGMVEDQDKVIELAQPILKLADRPGILADRFTGTVLVAIEVELKLLASVVGLAKARLAEIEELAQDAVSAITQIGYLTQLGSQMPVDPNGLTLEDVFDECLTNIGIRIEDVNALRQRAEHHIKKLSPALG